MTEQTTTPPQTRTEYYVRWPLGVLGWQPISEARYRAILARPEVFSGTKVKAEEARE